MHLNWTTGAEQTTQGGTDIKRMIKDSRGRNFSYVSVNCPCDTVRESESVYYQAGFHLQQMCFGVLVQHQGSRQETEIKSKVKVSK